MLQDDAATILLVNDDPVFEMIMVKIATRLNIALAVCHSLDELNGLEGLRFDAAVVDYDMGLRKGSRALEEIEDALGKTPIILVSEATSADAVTRGWRPSIKAFLPKAAGFRAILKTAVSAHHLSLAAD